MEKLLGRIEYVSFTKKKREQPVWTMLCFLLKVSHTSMTPVGLLIRESGLKLLQIFEKISWSKPMMKFEWLFLTRFPVYKIQFKVVSHSYII